ncbi:MAG: lipid-A-disaccharide synthase [Lewinellaceae bacterium]|nr:lipid-A-disaccharide synthase [Lewinellaceae bacterium]
MKLYIIAGEASGDLHGSNLIKALKRMCPGLQCRVWGGDLMRDAGGDLVKHYRDLAFMGFVEVLKNLRTILGNIAFCKRDILDFQPDALVLIDYPGFNLRIAKWAKQQGIKVIYYISPQIWAWHTSRVHDIRRDVDKMLVILPFEREFYQKYHIETEFVGHPLLDAIQSEEGTWKKEYPGLPVIALLPGSRKQEVQRILPVMLDVINEFPGYEFIIAGASSLPDEFYQPFLREFPAIKLQRGQTYALLHRATAALVKSGTSTLETALIGTPQVVCYAGNPVSYLIARRLVKIKYISLVNLIMDAPLVRELIQNELTRENLCAALSDILDPKRADIIRAGYAELRRKLGAGGASEKAARVILSVVQAPDTYP